MHGEDGVHKDGQDCVVSIWVSVLFPVFLLSRAHALPHVEWRAALRMNHCLLSAILSINVVSDIQGVLIQ